MLARAVPAQPRGTRDLADDEPVIESFRARLRRSSSATDRRRPASRHDGRNAEARQARCRSRDRAPCRIRPRSGLRRLHRIAQQRGRAITQALRQRPVEARRISVEQRAHIACAHGGGRPPAEPHETQRGAVAIVRVRRLRALERRDRAGTVAELFAQLAEHEPGRRQSRAQVPAPATSKSAAAARSPSASRSRAISKRRSAIRSPEDRNTG